MKLYSIVLAGLAIACFSFAGCDSADHHGNGETGGAAHTDDHGHDHDEHDDHAHAHGPNGGHTFKLSPAEYQAEWKQYKDNDVIKIYVLDADGKKNAAVAAESISVTPQVGSDKTPFVLPAENPDDNGETASFVLDDSKLKIAIPLGVDVEFTVGDKTFKGEIEAHEPRDH